MINITVVSYNNEVPASPVSAAFGREGGTLGRSKDNYFVLEDPKNFISRTQAWVKSDGVRHTIVNLSHANPILLNGQEIDAEREYELQSGDQIQIGLYLLRAETHPAAIAGGKNSSMHKPIVQLKPESGANASPALDAATVQQLPPNFALSNAAPMPAASATNGTPLNGRPQPQPPSSSSSLPDTAPATAEQVDNQALLQAFLNGAGIPSMTLSQGLTPELMEMIGRLLAISVQGTIGLNALRALVKREVNADVTMVVVRNNNPLKFFPDGETVLTQMFRKKMPGFMSPAEAMQDAYEDLHGHQLGVVAGMRAAMADLLKRFNPESLEKRIKDGSFLDSMVPANRKAKLWDLYTERFRKINLEAQDDFHMLFGQAFLQAYEAEVERFKNEAQNV